MLRISAAQAMLEALSAGVRFFQYRSKNGTRKQIYDTALDLARIAGEASALFIVNDHADIAAAVNAAGVHLGQDDLLIEHARKLLGRGKIIGISTHSIDQARAAETAGADYIGFGPIFSTATKDAGRVQGIDNLVLLRELIRVPIIAIGGINQSNVQAVLRSGADGVAVIGAVLSAEDITTAARDMMKLIMSS